MLQALLMLGVLVTLAGGLSVIASWRREQRDGRELVDRLIEANHAKRKVGMDKPDWRLIERAGAKTWRSHLNAQARLQRRVKPDQCRIVKIAERRSTRQNVI